MKFQDNLSTSAVPSFIAAFNAHFPLKTHPPIIPLAKSKPAAPTLWIHPPASDDTALSGDVASLRWQAYLALRGLKGIKVRWDISPEGSINGSLPNLHAPASDSVAEKVKFNLPDNQVLLDATSIPRWADMTLGVDHSAEPLEGYKDQEARMESRAWLSLLEGVVQAALITAQPRPSYLHSIIFPQSAPPLSESLQKILSPPPAPVTGIYALLPPSGLRINTASILSQYKEAIASLSQRLGKDQWFLGSSEPTHLDAVLFAFLHCVLHSSSTIRIEITRRVNLIAWEWKVRCLVREAFER